MLAREGYPVVLVRRNADALAPLVAEIESAGGCAMAIAADASDEEQVKGVFDQAESRFGTPHFTLFNAAGFVMGSVLDLDTQTFEEMWRATSYGGFLVLSLIHI